MSLPKKILLTGGSGYIGAHTVVELIAAGYDPIVIDNFSKSDKTLLDGIRKIQGKLLEFVEGDCCDKDFLSKLFKVKGPFSCVLHFAAYKSVGESVEQPLAYYRNNLGSLVTLMEVMQENNVRDLIFSSSCTVYGQPDHIPVNESAPFKRAESPYGATKQVCERILEDAFRYRIQDRFASLLQSYRSASKHVNRRSCQSGHPTIWFPTSLKLRPGFESSLPSLATITIHLMERVSVTSFTWLMWRLHT